MIIELLSFRYDTSLNTASLEESSLWLWFRSEKPFDPVCNLLACLLEFSGIVLVRGVQFHAVATVVAV